MKKLFAILLALVMMLSIVACGSKDEGASAGEGAAATNDLKIGVILLHNDQIGYDAAHMEGIKAAAAALNLSDDQIIWKYEIPETDAAYDAAVDLAEQGCDIIFADSFGHGTYMLQAATEYPDIQFFHATGTNAYSSDLKNFHNYFTKVFESRYVSGVVAGLKLKEMLDAGVVTDPYVGYVGAFPYAEVKSGYTAFLLGIRSIVPDAHMDVMYTNSWADQTAEYDAATALIARGCVIIGQHADTTGAPTAVQAALDSGKTVYCVGYNVDMLAAAPTAALTSAQNNWGTLYKAMIEAAIAGGEIADDFSAGYADNGVMISAFGPSCAAGTAEKVAEVEKAIAEGTLHVFDTTTFTVNGETLSGYDQSWGFEGIQLIWDGFFHESEIISAPLLDFVIDGITVLN